MEAHAIGLPLLYDMKNDVCGDYQMKRLLLLWLSCFARFCIVFVEYFRAGLYPMEFA